MSYRDTLISIRESLLATDRAIEACEADVPSDAARTYLGRARAMSRAAQQLIGAALKESRDAAAPLPLTAESRR